MTQKGDSDKKPTKKNPAKSVLAGGIAGGLEILCTYPTEYIKTQLQLDQRSKHPRYNGAIDCFRKTQKQHGLSGLYRGLNSLLYGSIPKSAIRFSVYDYCRNLTIGDESKLSKIQSLSCGLIAGICEAVLIVCPMETIKVIMINDQLSLNSKYKKFFSGVYTIVKEQGIKGVYKGIVPTVIKQGSNQAVRFFVFDSLKARIRGNGNELGLLQTFVIGALAGTASVYGNTPIDVVKTRLQGLESYQYKGTIDCIKKIYQNEGVFAFYKGTLPRLSRVAFDVAFQFTIYEQAMKFLNYLF
ncbi:hypothetical protein HZS_168 [Henneguya salminicola]|nr:hypothetical protein HZS_168 [Henneguya salminicola]